MRNVTLAATQMACSWDIDANIARAEGLVRAAHDRGAGIVLLQELFETPYFCIEQEPRHFALARSAGDSRVVQHFTALARALGVVLPVSFFERAGPAFFNSLIVIDADGSHVAHYRKTHIPQNPGYEEKFYFSPGDTGFQVAETRFGRIGCGICWDQWFPEAARCMALKGAEILLYPTAIGSEPADPDLDSSAHWRRTMQGHAAANIVPLVASNRVGRESGARSEITFYGTSFIADHTGAILADADRESESVITATVDLDAIAEYRATWGLFRDRRPEWYRTLLSLDGTDPAG
ncbi:MAG: N-carbamoylputrescine amidase [Alphaproteobacteria bacterium]|nr:MAG: N-carbamoylputrescine amidase [Alphaproteobacteria bacterium]